MLVSWTWKLDLHWYGSDFKPVELFIVPTPIGEIAWKEVVLTQTDICSWEWFISSLVVLDGARTYGGTGSRMGLLYQKSIWDKYLSDNALDRIIWKANRHSRVVKAHLAYIVSLKSLEELEGWWWHSVLWQIKIAGKI